MTADEEWEEILNQPLPGASWWDGQGIVFDEVDSDQMLRLAIARATTYTVVTRPSPAGLLKGIIEP